MKNYPHKLWAQGMWTLHINKTQLRSKRPNFESQMLKVHMISLFCHIHICTMREWGWQNTLSLQILMTRADHLQKLREDFHTSCRLGTYPRALTRLDLCQWSFCESHSPREEKNPKTATPKTKSIKFKNAETVIKADATSSWWSCFRFFACQSHILVSCNYKGNYLIQTHN